jgi:hypothetical protein
MAAFLSLSLAASLALIWHLHGDPDHAIPLGAWSLRLEIAAALSAAVQAFALFARLRGGEIAPRPLRLGLYVLGFAWLSSLFHPYEQAASYYTLVIALGVYAALVSLPSLKPGALDVIATNVCVLFVGAELSLRALGLFVHSPLLTQQVSDATEWLAANHLKPGELRLGFPANSQGFYDDEFVKKPAGGCLVTAIGDSFTLGAVPHDWHFASVAERALDCPIDAFGVGAVGPEEYLLMEKNDALPLDPDVVLIDVFVGNDLVENLRGRDHFRNGLRSWLDRDNLLSYAVPKRLVSLARHRAAHATTPASQRTLSRDETLAAYPWLADPVHEPAHGAHDWYVHKEATETLEWGAGHDEWAYARFEELMREMRALAGGRKFAVLLIPAEEQVEDWLFDELRPQLGGATIERDRPQRMLGAWLKSEGIPALDLLPLLRAVPPLSDGRRHVYHLDDSHLNARGNEVAGKALAEFLRPMLPKR